MSDNPPDLPASTCIQDTGLEATKKVPETASAQDTSTNSLGNGITSTKTKLAFKKPPPPVQAKPSRFLKTKSLTLSSLPKLGHKSSNAKLKEGNEENIEAISEAPTPQDPKGQHRESHHWKLRGISSLKKNRRHSAVEENTSIPSDQSRLSNTPAEKHKGVVAAVNTPPRQPRELPALPTIPPLGVPLPLSNLEGQNDTHPNISPQTTGQDVAEAVPASTMADHIPEVNVMDVKECSTLSISIDPNGSQSHNSLTYSTESLTLQMTTDDPQSSSTPKSVHSFAPNEQVEKTDTIHRVIENYPRYIPVRIRVLQGYCSDTADINISTGDLYDIQQIRTTKVVTVRDQDGMSCRVPIESSMKFGLVFNLSSNYDEGLCGYTFKAVSDLTSLSILPKIVCTMKAYEGNDTRGSVQENEILIIQQTLKSMFRGKRGIKVYSLRTRTEKVLPEECDVGFSTNPSLVRLHPSDIIEHIANPFPAHAVMYPSAENTVEDPGTLSRVITMLDYSTKQSLIVSAVVGENDDTATDESSFFEIPLDNDMKDIEVSVLKWTTPPESPEMTSPVAGDEATSAYSSDDDDHVYDDTVNLLQTSETLRHLAESRRSSNSVDGFGNMSGRSSPGIHMGGTPPLPDKPKWLSQHPPPSASDVNSHASKYDNIPPGLPAARSEGKRMTPISQISEEEDPGYDTVGIHLLKRGVSATDTPGYNKLQYEGYDGSDPRIVSWMEDLQSATNSLESRLISLEHFHKQAMQSTEIKGILTILEQLTQKIESFDSQLQTLTLSRSNSETCDADLDTVNYQQGSDQPASDEQSNQDYLKSLDTMKVCELIDVMGLGQYKKRFVEEHISGEILLECDEQILQEELGVQSRIHRIRLMKVITGLHSAKALLNK